MNWVVRALDREGEALTLEDARRRRKPGEEGLWRITQCLLQHRHLWPGAGLIEFVCAALEEV